MPICDRAQFVAEACKDNAALRKELEELLEANEDEAGALETPLIRIKSPSLAEEPALASGQVINGRFEIVRHLGSGGMGEVYEAIDLQLGRVALKTIRPDFAAAAEQFARFKMEVRLARKVSDPHVCRIYDLHLLNPGTDGLQEAFLTMELLEGMTLADRIRKGGPLPWREVKNIAIDVCEGLQSIHEAGIVHRDLKGRNIMLTSRNCRPCAVLMDFGIAHRVSQLSGETSTALTRRGAIVGTPDYMAPEQFEGRDVTPATDVYALGIVIYESLTGKRPFADEAKARMRPATTNHATRVSAIKPGVPHLFDRVIAKCLEYDPQRRFQTARSAKQALSGGAFFVSLRNRPLVAAAWAMGFMLLLCSSLLIPPVGERARGIFLSSREKHIAILPFNVIGSTPETQAVGDGLMDSFAGKLSNLDAVNKTLWVVPPDEVRLRKVNNPASALREFGATIVVEGSIERLNEVTHLRLTLIDPRKTREIGFIDLEDRSGNLSELLDEAVTRAGRLMNISIEANLEQDASGQVPPPAYEDYLEGLGYFARFDKPGNIDLAIDSLQMAIEKDPRFALGFARLAQVYTMKYRFDSNPEWLKRAEDDCRQALGLNGNLPSAYVALGKVHELTGRHEMAVEEFQRAIDLDPRDAEAVSGLAYLYESMGRTSDAEAEYIKAASLRPEDWTGYNILGTFYDDLGRHSEAIAQYLHALELTPDNDGVYENLGIAYGNSDDPAVVAKAEWAFKKSIEISPTYAAYSSLACLYLGQHRFLESISASKTALSLNKTDYNVWTNLMAAYEWLKDTAKADDARATAMKLLEIRIGVNPEDAYAQATLAALLAKTGARDKSLNGIHISLALSPNSGYVLGQVADAYELMGDRKNAIVYLRKAMAHGLSRLEVREDPEIQPVLQDPHFKSQTAN